MPAPHSTNPPPELTAVGFDLGDTLVEYEGIPLNWVEHYGAALRELARFLGVAATPADIAAAGDVLRRYNTRLHPRTHEVPFATILRELAEVLGQIVPPAELPAAAAFFRLFRQRLRALPEAEAVLHAVRTRHGRVGVFTDVPYGMPQELVEADLASAGLRRLVDVLVTSRQAGFRKPHPAALQALARRLGCPPAALTYVGNEQKDVDAARAAGCHSVLLNRSGETPDWGQDRTIHSLSELLAS